MNILKSPRLARTTFRIQEKRAKGAGFGSEKALMDRSKSSVFEYLKKTVDS